jgi:integrase
MASAPGLARSSPFLLLQLSDEKEPFKTWGQIETIIKRGKLKDEKAKDYWDCLFLDEGQVLELLDYVKKNAEHPFIYAAIAFAAFTGARRSEIMRSEIDDWDFDRGFVRIREKKGSKKKKTTFREVNIHPQLGKVMMDWFKLHPGGVRTIVVPPNLPRSRCKQDGPTPMTRNQAHGFFQRTLNGSKWQVLRGWHVLRHSFCSNCARRSFPDTIIDEWMGHRGNEDVKKRYRHLFPSDKKAVMEKLFT